jgi:hypothetical protein
MQIQMSAHRNCLSERGESSDRHVQWRAEPLRARAGTGAGHGTKHPVWAHIESVTKSFVSIPRGLPLAMPVDSSFSMARRAVDPALDNVGQHIKPHL